MATLAYNTINTLNLANYITYEYGFGRKPKLLLDLETNPYIIVSGIFKDYSMWLNKRLQYCHKLFQDLRSKKLAMINNDRSFFQYNSRDLVYIMSLLTSQLRTSSRNVDIKYVGPLVIYKKIDPHNCVHMMLGGKILRGLFEHK